ncbi:MAG: CPBP family glutamic-type intramembrane protease [Acidimicrobiales bacterium]
MSTADSRFSGTVAVAAKRRRWWSPPPPPSGPATISTKQAYLEVLVVFGVFFGAGVASAAFAIGGHSADLSAFGWSDAIPDAINQIATTVLCILVPLLLVRRRGLAAGDLGLAKPGTVSGSQGIRMAAWAVLALIAGGAVTTALAFGHNYPESHSIAYLTASLFHGAQAGFIEEIVVLAFLVVTLEQARRPRPEIIAVALLLRVSYHIYYGWGALGIFVWAAIFLWLFFRFRTIIPLIIVHSTWDVTVFLANEWRPVSGFLVFGMLALFVTAFSLWVVDRSHRNAAPPMRAGAPGWYPDPGGSGALRWFDGWVWTSYLNPPATQTWGHPPWNQQWSPGAPPAPTQPWLPASPSAGQGQPWSPAAPPGQGQPPAGGQGQPPPTIRIP